MTARESASDKNTSSNIPPRLRKVTPFTPPRNNLGEDELLAKTFIDLMQIKADHGEFDRIHREPQDRKGVVKVMMPGMIFGGIAAIGTFITLRRLPKHLMQRALEKKESFIHGRGGNPYFDIVRKQGPWLPHVKTRRDGSIRFYEGWILSPILTAIDAVLACVTGGVVWVVTTPRVKLFEAAADIPLVPGRSAISDTLCSDFIENYKRLPKELWTPKKIHRDDVTKSIKTFVENCQRRQRMERQLRYNAGLDENDAVDIPYPGVPAYSIVEVEEPPEEVEVIVDRKRGFWLDDWEEEDDEDDDLW
jgi:hypothetical protein